MKALIVVAMCFVTVLCQEQALQGETGEPEPVEEPNADEIQQAASVIAESLGFRCGKGNQCVPALVPVPCEYGTFKDQEGFLNCVPCEPGCTTLRKGAESMYECVPFCPHGYERSRDTCTPCRPGYYKSSWLDEDCTSCPVDSNPDPDAIGLSSETECYGNRSDTGDESDEDNPEPEEPRCPEEACAAEVEMERRPLIGSQCTKYCECSMHEAFFGQFVYIWEPRNCSPGMLFDRFTLECFDSESVLCNGSPTTGTGYMTSTVAPDVPDLECPSANFQLVIVSGSGCRKFYECVNSQWLQMDCPAGTVFSPNVGSCIWEDSFTCPENGGFDGEQNSTTENSTTGENSTTNSSTDGEPLFGCPETSCSFHTLDLLRNFGSQCTKFCQCTPRDNSLQYHWVEKPCAPGTLFTNDLGSCDHATTVTCEESP